MVSCLLTCFLYIIFVTATETIPFLNALIFFSVNMLISLDSWTTRSGNHLVCCLKTSLWRDLPLPKMLWKMSNGNALGLFGMILKMKKIIDNDGRNMEKNKFDSEIFPKLHFKKIWNIYIFINRFYWQYYAYIYNASMCKILSLSFFW